VNKKTVDEQLQENGRKIGRAYTYSNLIKLVGAMITLIILIAALKIFG